MIDIIELKDIEKRLIQILNNEKKNKASRRILVLINGMIQAINTIMRLVRFEENKRKLLEEEEKRKQKAKEQEKMNVNTPQ